MKAARSGGYGEAGDKDTKVSEVERGQFQTAFCLERRGWEAQVWRRH